jgi:uncharacterized membrane protein HdeD (DUF308 family)
MSGLTAQDGPQQIITRAIRAHSGLYLAEGIALMVLGLGAMIIPPIAGLATTIFLGWLFLLAGSVGLAASWHGRTAPGFIWSVLSAVAALVAGLVLLFYPLQGLITLTFVLTAFFVVDGLFMAGFALAHRRELSGRWEWMLFNGVIDLVLAGIIISGMPGTFAWALGLIVGIDLLFGGVSLVMMALEARR